MESRRHETGASVKTAAPSSAQSAKLGGLSPARLTRLHDALRRHVDNGRLPGLVAAISRRGSEHIDAIGTLGFDRIAPLRRDTLFRIHGTNEPQSIGTAASSGCIRMLNEEVSELYDSVQIGTKVIVI